MEFREVAHGSAGYRETVELRLEVLRRPIGLSFSDEQLSMEAGEIHLAGIEDGVVVACLVLVLVSEREVKMRQVAVASSMQGLGVGTRLVEASEGLARRRGFELMTLHARETAVAFYLRMGYAVVGEPFVEVSLAHRAMEKRL